MFYHNDLSLYKNPSFRSYNYLKEIWKIIEFDLIFIVGIINNGNITINIESDFLQVIATSNFRNIFNKNYETNFSHSLNLCYDFVTDITINIVDTVKEYYFSAENCRFYYDKTNLSDEGFVECNIFSNVKISSFNEFKVSFFSLLCKELQFVINKNVFLLDIEKKDIIQADIDSLYESVDTNSKLKKISFAKSLEKIVASKEDKELLSQLKNQIDKT